jgi:VanZ family protein
LDFIAFIWCIKFTLNMLLKKHWKSLLWSALVLLACAIPSNKVPDIDIIKMPHFDKVVHFGMFFILALLLVSENNNLKDKGLVNKSTFLWAGIIAIVYGLSIEAIQYFFLPTRSGSWGDMLANIVGTLTAFVLYRYVNRFSRGIL